MPLPVATALPRRFCREASQHIYVCDTIASLHQHFLNTARTNRVIGSHAFSVVNSVAVWRNGNVVGRIIEVALRRARLVLERVTVVGRANDFGM